MDNVINMAPVKWAQRSDSLYVTIDLQDVSDDTIELNDKELNFKGKSGGHDYEVHIVFFKPVDSKNSKTTYKVTRSVHFHIMKQIPEGGEDDEAVKEAKKYWPRLLEDKALEKNERYNLTVDWDKFCDEDDEKEKGGFDMSAFHGLDGI